MESMDAKAIQQAIQAGGGKATLTTIQGEPLTATIARRQAGADGCKRRDRDCNHPNVYQSNGVIHVIDAVLLPN